MGVGAGVTAGAWLDLSDIAQSLSSKELVDLFQLGAFDAIEDLQCDTSVCTRQHSVVPRTDAVLIKRQFDLGSGLDARKLLNLVLCQLQTDCFLADAIDLIK